MKNLCVCNDKECLTKVAVVVGAVATVAVATWGVIKFCKSRKKKEMALTAKSVEEDVAENKPTETELVD